jgi:hypothetical protein
MNLVSAIGPDRRAATATHKAACPGVNRYPAL